MKILGIFCVCVAIAFPSQSWAAKFYLDAQVSEAFSADGLLTPIPLPDYRRPVGYPAVYKIDYSVITNVAELAPDELGFGIVSFSIDQSNGLRDTFKLGWSPSTETIDTNGSTPGGVIRLFPDNLDAGTPGDLVGILVSVAGVNARPPITDARAYVGQNGPTYIGSVYLAWGGITPGFASTKVSKHDPPMTALFSALKLDGRFKTTAESLPSKTIYFGNQPLLSNPEPTSAILLLGMSVPIAFRRTK